MRTLFALAMVLSLCGAAPSRAQADDGRVHVLPLVAETHLKRDKKLLQEADGALRDAAEATLGERLDMAGRARSARCATSAACVGKLAKRAGAAQGVSFVLRRQDGQLAVAFLVADASGAEVSQGERPLNADDLAGGMRAVLEELFAAAPVPQMGKLIIADVDEAAWISIDGVPVARKALAAGVSLSVGRHEVKVLRAGESSEVHTVEIVDEAPVRQPLDPAPAPPAPEVIVQAPLWPTVAGAGITSGFLLVAALFSLDLLLGASLNQSSANIEPPAAGTALFPAYVARQPGLLRARGALASDGIIIAVAASGAVVAAATTAAFATAWVLGASKDVPGATDEGPAASKPATPDAAANNGEEAE